MPPLTVAIADNAIRRSEGINGHWFYDLWNGCAPPARLALRCAGGADTRVATARLTDARPGRLCCLPGTQCRHAREVALHDS